MPSTEFASRSRFASTLVGLALVAPAAASGQKPPRVIESTPKTASEATEGLDFANRLYKDRRYDLAAEEYERFLETTKAGPEAADAGFSLGNARLFLGKYKEARRAFEEFLQIAPDHPNAPTARFRVGETAYVLGDLPAARQSLEAYLQGAGELRYREAAWSHLGDVASRQGDLPRARQAYEQVLAGKPTGNLGLRAQFGLGRTLVAQGEPGPAIQVLTKLAEQGGPEWADKAWFQVGQVQAGAGRWAEAVAAFEALESASPRSALLAEARLEKAEGLIQLGRRDQAEALLQSLLDEPAPGIAAQAADALGASQLAGGHPDQALDTLDRALAKFAGSPSGPMIRYHSAEALLALKKPDEARARFLQLAEAGPAVPWSDSAQVRAAGLALDARDIPEARRLAGGFAAKFPDSPLKADARLIDARAALAAGQPGEAIALLGEGFAADKPSPATAQAGRYYLGLAYRANNQPAEAAAILDAVAQAPENPVAADAQFMLGQGHVESGKFAEAVDALEKYLANRPNGEVADHALARIVQARIGLGQLDEAARALERLVSAHPKSPALAPSRLRLGEAALAAKQYDGAAEWLRLAAEGVEPARSARARSGQGWALLQGNHPAEAATAFAALIEATPDDPLAPEAALARARALEAANQPEAAREAYAKVAQAYPKSPQAGPASLALARMLARAEQHEAAAAAFEGVARDHAATAGEPSDAVLAEWGWALIDAGKPAEADAVFERLLREAPDSPHAADARFNLAESAFAARKLDRVAELLAPVIAPGSTAKPALIQSSLYRMGRAEVEAQDWSKAAATFRRLLAEYPDGTFRREARFWGAEVASKLDDAATAESEFAALIADPPAPTDPKGLVETARRRQVQCLVQLGRWADVLAAADAFAAAAPDDPQMAEVDYARGRAFQALARFDEARDAFARAIVARKGSELAARAQLMRGETYFHQEKYRDALREFLRVALNYDAPEWQAAALLEAGKVHEKLEEWPKAVETYEKLRKQFPDDRNAAEAARRIEAARDRVARPEGQADARTR
ncbi:tetratricopeptide repeat protein [Tundrisphaera sp. TA3]|uniref:tetratricopeptide repeat protein n=1 Tax=Tundrisphaera sp. TA3 TaxID=3435775 RepID=UPI003EBD3AA2